MKISKTDQKQTSKSDLQQASGGKRPPPLTPVPVPDPPAWEEVPFAPPDPEATYEALEQFYAEHPCAVSLRPASGLPTFLYGRLGATQGKPYTDAAEEFLHANELMLTGLSDEAWFQQTHEWGWRDGITQVMFAQTNVDDVPLYGSNIVCSFTEDELGLVTDTAFPAPAELINELEWGDSSWLSVSEGNLKKQYLDISPAHLEAPPHLRRESRERGLLADRWILPYQSPGGEPGIFRPVWRMILKGPGRKRWLALVDAETWEILFSKPAWVGDKVYDAQVYLTDLQAVDNQLASVTLDYGAGTTLGTADRVRIQGARNAEPLGSSTEQILSANAFYHVFQSQDLFMSVLKKILDPPDALFPGVNPLKTITVDLDDMVGSGEYHDTANTIWIGMTTQIDPTVKEPGFDPELIFHEFAHAINHNLKPEVFNFAHVSERLYTQGLDEGLAFYFACAFGGNEQWAQFAYQHPSWKQIRNLTQGPKELFAALAKLNDDHADMYHGLGMWWARLFWTLSTQLGEDRCKELLLLAFEELSGPVNFPDKLGIAMVHHAATQQEQSIIVSSFSVHGVTVPVVSP
jgi:hypothetical protein